MKLSVLNDNDHFWGLQHNVHDLRISSIGRGLEPCKVWHGIRIQKEKSRTKRRTETHPLVEDSGVANHESDIDVGEHIGTESELVDFCFAVRPELSFSIRLTNKESLPVPVALKI